MEPDGRGRESGNRHLGLPRGSRPTLPGVCDRFWPIIAQIRELELRKGVQRGLPSYKKCRPLEGACIRVQAHGSKSICRRSIWRNVLFLSLFTSCISSQFSGLNSRHGLGLVVRAPCGIVGVTRTCPWNAGCFPVSASSPSWLTQPTCGSCSSEPKTATPLPFPSWRRYVAFNRFGLKTNFYTERTAMK